MNTNARLAQFRMQVAQALKSGATATGQTTRRVDPTFAPAPPPTHPGPMQAVLRSTLSRLNAQIVSARTSGPLYDLVDSYILTVAQLAATLPQSPAPPGSVLGASLSAVALVIAMFYIDWMLTLIVLAIYPFAVLPMGSIGKRLRKVSHRTQTQIGDTTSRLTEISPAPASSRRSSSRTMPSPGSTRTSRRSSSSG